MKVALERIQPLKRKTRYQIDKLLVLSTLGRGADRKGSTGMFTAMGREEEEEADKKKVDDKDETAIGADDGGNLLSFKPYLEGMMKILKEEDGNNGVSDKGGRERDDSTHLVCSGGQRMKIFIVQYSHLLYFTPKYLQINVNQMMPI
jgi:hypothetical protein